jgi:IclR family transcriptional regulator, acetate operon repressor
MTLSSVQLSHDALSTRVDDMVGLGVAGKAFAMAELLVSRDYPVQMSEIVQVSGIPKPSAHRLINFLVECGYAQRHPVLTGYIPGKNLFLLAHQVLSNRTGSRPQTIHLERLVARVNETVNVGALIGNHVVYHDRVEASWPLGLHFEAGSKVPMHCTSIGKLMLALNTKSDVEVLLSKTDLQRYTQNTTTNSPDLLRELEKIKSQDFSVDDQEFMDGVCCIAVPLRTSNGRVFAGMAVSAPEARLSRNELEKLLPELRQTAYAYVLELESQKHG